MTDLFEDRFAKIKIGKSPTRRKKAYPMSLYPSDPANSQARNLPPLPALPTSTSTIPKLKQDKHQNENSAAKRVRSHNNQALSNEREKPAPSCTTPLKAQFSFMRETTSSLKKKQNPYIPALNSMHNITAALHDLTTSTPIGNSATKKRLEYSRQLSESMKSKRVGSANKSSPTDITNISLPEKIPKDEESPTPQKTRNISQPLPLRQQNNSGNVFNRLYPFPTNGTMSTSSSLNNLSLSIAPKNDIDERMRQQQKNHRLIHQQRQIQQRHLQKQRQLQSHNQQRHFSIPKQTQHIANDTLVSHEDNSSQRGGRPSRSKVASLESLFMALKIKNPPQLIDDTESILAQEISSNDVMKANLNAYEQGEIVRKKGVYFIPQNVKRKVDVQNYKTNFGFDDNQGNYNIVFHDHINYRYEVLLKLGNGTFGNVTLARDHKYKSRKFVALKIIKNDLNWSLQSINEIKILKALNTSTDTCDHVLKYLEHFNFRSHMCIVTELLSVNLFTVIESTGFKGMELELVQQFARQILKGIEFIHKHKIIHCDIKPENIMLSLPTNDCDTALLLKIIDFGSACFHDEITFTYIQSRYYRAPEVILGAKYNEKIDIWSAGCVLVELLTGTPLASGQCDVDQFGQLTEILGNPKPETIQRLAEVLLNSTKRKLFTQDPLLSSLTPPQQNEKTIRRAYLFKIFNQSGHLIPANLSRYSEARSKRPGQNGRPRQYIAGKHLEARLGLPIQLSSIEKNFLDFIKHILCWDPSERFNSTRLLNEAFLHIE